MKDLKECREAFEKWWEEEDLDGYGINRADARLGFKAAWNHRPKEEKLREALEKISKLPGKTERWTDDYAELAKQALSEEGGE